MENEKYYFTYGIDDKYPFKGGWTEVSAPTEQLAVLIFTMMHPKPKNKSLYNAAAMYNEKAFNRTDMSKNGNHGQYCHETIKLSIENDSEKYILNGKVEIAPDISFSFSETPFVRIPMIVDNNLCEKLVSRTTMLGDFDCDSFDELKQNGTISIYAQKRRAAPLSITLTFIPKSKNIHTESYDVKLFDNERAFFTNILQNELRKKADDNNKIVRYLEND